MQTDIYKRAKVNNIFNLAGNFHSNLEVFKVQNAFLHDWSRIAVARITVRFCKLFNNIVNCSFADTVFFFQLLFQLCGNLFFFLNKRKNFFCNFVVFRVNPSVIKRIWTFWNFQESRALLKCLWSKPRNFFQILAACYFSVCITVGNNFFCKRTVDSRNIF